MASKKNFYAVAVGKEPGIYTDWPSAERQVRGFAGAKFKGFATKDEAEAWCKDPLYSSSSAKSTTKKLNVTPAAYPTTGRDDAIIIYTDGGCSGNPGPGGYGTVILDGESRSEYSGGYRLTTNNRMEMLACLVGLRRSVDLGKKIYIFSDSSYVVNAITKSWAVGWRRRGWKKSDGKPAVNADIWADILTLVEKCDVQFHWIKGHAGHELNERCDQLAVAAAAGDDLGVDQGYEKSLQQ